MFRCNTLKFGLKFIEFSPNVIKFTMETMKFTPNVIEFGPNTMKLTPKMIEFASNVMKFRAKTIEFASNVMKFRAKVNEFAPNAMKFAPKTIAFALKMMTYGPKTIEFASNMMKFGPETIEFVPKTMKFGPDTLEFAPATISLGPSVRPSNPLFLSFLSSQTQRRAQFNRRIRTNEVMASAVGRVYCVPDVPAMQSVETVTVRGPIAPVRMVGGNHGVDDLDRRDRETPLRKAPLDIGEHFSFDRPHGNAIRGVRPLCPAALPPLLGRAARESFLPDLKPFPCLEETSF